MHDALERGRAWLAAQRNRDGSWGYHPGQPGRPEPSVLVGAAGLEAPVDWLEMRDLGWVGRLLPSALHAQPDSEALRKRELERLLRERSETGHSQEGFDASLPAWGWVSGTAGWTEPTAHALLALRTAGLGAHARAHEAIAFLLDRQGSDGGWNYGNPRMLGRELDSAPVATGWALLALARLPQGLEPCGRGLSWLTASCDRLPSAHSLAMSVLAHAAMGRDPTLGAQALVGRQDDDGGWRGRCDLTALACAALSAATGGPCPLTPGGQR
jgi:hypothetical protein